MLVYSHVNISQIKLLNYCIGITHTISAAVIAVELTGNLGMSP